eukprot:scpid92207/ scgid24112/ 
MVETIVDIMDRSEAGQLRAETEAELKAKSGEFYDSTKACAAPRARLLQCLRASNCVKERGLTPRECLLLKEEGAYECEQFRLRLFYCKHSMVSKRSRLRGLVGND